MKQYIIPVSNSPFSSPKAEISTFLWETNGYSPKTTAQLAINNEKLMLYMECYESNPLAKCTADESEIWCDSCMEFFFAPNDDKRYCNLEINANGCTICGLGESRFDRISVDFLLKRIEAMVKSDKWSIYAEISLEKLRKIYGNITFESFRGNLYKCGDETEFPHFGMWSPIDWEEADFHRPEFFGKFLIEK